MIDKEIMGYLRTELVKASEHDVYTYISRVRIYSGSVTKAEASLVRIGLGDFVRDDDGKLCQLSIDRRPGNCVIAAVAFLRKLRPSELQIAWDRNDISRGDLASVVVSRREVEDVARENPTAQQALEKAELCEGGYRFEPGNGSFFRYEKGISVEDIQKKADSGDLDAFNILTKFGDDYHRYKRNLIES